MRTSHVVLCMIAAALLVAGQGIAPVLVRTFEPPNPSFEDDLACPPHLWTEYISGGGPRGTGCASDDRARTGRNSAKLTDGGDGVYTGIVSTRVGVEHGVELSASIWTSAPAQRDVHLFLYLYDVNDNQIAEVSNSHVAQDAWTKLTTSFNAPTPDNAVYTRMLVYSCMACGGTFYVDDASFTEIGSPLGGLP